MTAPSPTPKPPDVAAIRARVDAATEPPWEPWDKSVNGKGLWIASTFQHEDADFIAHARTDIPALLDALEAAQAAATACSLAKEDAELERDEARGRADRADAALAALVAEAEDACRRFHRLNALGSEDGFVGTERASRVLGLAHNAGLALAVDRAKAALAGPPP